MVPQQQGGPVRDINVRRFDGLAPGRVVIVGIGNTLMADDGAGPAIAEQLCRRFPDVVFDAGQAPENYVAPVRRAVPQAVVLVDAADFGGAPGEVRVASADDVSGLMLGTHAPPLSMFMKLIADETGADVRLAAIQVKTTELGGVMSDEVIAAVETLATEIAQLLEGRAGS